MKDKLTTVFTNGCFEILHLGHLHLLRKAKSLSDELIVGLNSDKSFEKLRGRKPFRNQVDREVMLLHTKYVNDVIIFDEERPDNLIKKLRPDIIVKGGDWEGKLEIEKELVKEWGGKVIAIPRLSDYSTTNIISDIQKSCFPENEYMKLHCETIKKLEEKYKNTIKEIIDVIFKSFKRGGKLVICGNGGSAADAIHLAGEFMCIGLPAIALTENISAVTSMGNDVSYEYVFHNLLVPFLDRKDILLLLSTSGKSKNILRAALEGQRVKCKTITFTGQNPSPILVDNSSYTIQIPSTITEIVQEVYFMINHMIYKTIRERMKGEING